MTATDAVAVVAWLVITASFCFVRRSLGRHVAACGVVAAPPMWATFRPAPAPDREQWLLLLLGILLYGAGLLVLRLILRRSVSLHLLFALSAGQGSQRIREEMVDRLADLERFRLASCRARSYALTPFGRVTAAAVSAIYALFALKGAR
jgi:hypothetical protein